MATYNYPLKPWKLPFRGLFIRTPSTKSWIRPSVRSGSKAEKRPLLAMFHLRLVWEIAGYSKDKFQGLASPNALWVLDRECQCSGSLRCCTRLKCHFLCFKPSVLRNYADKLTNTKTKLNIQKIKFNCTINLNDTKCITIFSCSQRVTSDIYLQVIELHQSTE